jgi:hypothetical protein
MTYQRRVVRRPADAHTYRDVADDEVVDSTTVARPSGGELGRRIVVLAFGIIELFIALRIVLLLLDARQANDIVRFVLDVSQVFVAPFLGIFRLDALKGGGAVFDVAAAAALVGWTVLEAVAILIVNLFRREPAA